MRFLLARALTAGARPVIGLFAALAALAALAVLGSGCGADDRPTSFRYLHAAILDPSCATVSCHSESNAQQGIALHTPEAAYRALVGDDCDDLDPAPGSGVYVIAGAPESSLLMVLLEGAEVTPSMPPDRLLPLPDLALIETWIARGAPCD